MKVKFAVLFTLVLGLQEIYAQRGYFDAPYKRYEADKALLSQGVTITPISYSQADVQVEASDRVCVEMDSVNSSIEFILSDSADGMVLRYCVPDSHSAVIWVYADDIKIDSLVLSSKWSWEYLWSNGDPNNIGLSNKNPRMRFDEIRYKLPYQVTNLKLVADTGKIWIDFVEMERVPAVIDAPEGAYVYTGDGSTLQSFIDQHGGHTIYVPPGMYNINSQLYFGISDTKLQGAGMWYTQLNFTVTDATNGGLRANALNVSYSDLYLTTDMTTRTKGYSGIQGVYTAGSIIRNIWAEHFGTGAWIGQYVSGGPAYADGFLITGCRFRDTYADGINLCKGTRNAIVEHCNCRNNGDDGEAIWCAEGLECINNTFRFNTVENGWRAAGAALYGGKNNKFYNILIKDNLEIGITVSNLFQGVGFNSTGLHDIHDITLIGCGTFNDCFNNNVGAIDIVEASSAGTRVQNVLMYNIDVIDAKCDAIRIFRNSGNGLYNFKLENISINGTGKEYPFNNVENSNKGRGYVAVFENNPLGSATYCGLTYSNLGGSSDTLVFDKTEIGTFKWTELTDCAIVPVSGVHFPVSDTSLLGGQVIQLKAILEPNNSTNQIIDYTVDNPQVAIINSAGEIKAISKGTTTITAKSFDGGFVATCVLTVRNDPYQCYTIQNRWQNTYLSDGGDRVRYSTTAMGNTYLWLLENSGGKVAIRNFSSKNYMSIENMLGYVECDSVFPRSERSWWILDDAGSGYTRFQSASDTSLYIHIENLQNQAQYGSISESWWSAMWSLVPVTVINSISEKHSEFPAFVYPNPSDGNFNFAIKQATPFEELKITIYNIAGQVVLKRNCTTDDKGNLYLPFSNGDLLEKGNYVLEARGNSMISRSKIMIIP